ncbi:MAG: hypothetical protein AAF234_00280 [Pseudomonadota bacterium]
MLRFVSAMLLAGAIATPPSAVAQTTLADLPPELRIYIERFPRQALGRLTEALNAVNPDAPVTQAQINTHLLRRGAQIRASLLRRLLVVDLNADYALSPDEIETVIPNRSFSEGSMRAFMDATDVDGDGTATQAEIDAFVAEQVDAEVNDQRLPSGEWARYLMLFDLNADKQVERAELDQFFVDLINAQASATGAPGAQPTSPSEPASAQGCELPAPSSNAQIVVIGGYEGSAISSVAVGDLDEITTVVSLDVTPGDEPVYLAVTNFRPTVWNLTGATERIEQVVSLSASRPSGFTGVDAARVAFPGDRQCALRYFTDSDGGHAAQARGRLTFELGRVIDHLYGSYELGQLLLANDGITETGSTGRRSGDIVIVSDGTEFEISADGVRQISESGDAESVRAELLRFFPLGVVRVDPSAVVTTGTPAQAYDVLPAQAGLLQLLRSGAISRTSDGFFSIDQPIVRFPAGLNGAHSVRFVVRTGVPFPAGSPGHSTVVIEETGECIGTRCR